MKKKTGGTTASNGNQMLSAPISQKYSMRDLLRNIWIFRIIVRLIRETRIIFYALQNSLSYVFLRRMFGRSIAKRQKILTWELPLQLPDPQALRRCLLDRDITFHEGGNALYIPPQPALDSVLGNMVGFYPPNAGFKILKEFRSPEEACYTGQNEFWAKKILTGKPTDQVDAANAAYEFGIGPQIYDLTMLATGNVRLTCFVVQHIDGSAPSNSDHEVFVTKLRGLVQSGALSLVPYQGLAHDDFAAPDCFGNLIKDNSGHLQYVDFQQFIIPDPPQRVKQALEKGIPQFHFGDQRAFRPSKYPYQSLPGISGAGKRDTNKRWKNICAILAENRISCQNRIIFDIGCNQGMVLHNALADGALWGLGWDLPNIIPHTQDLHSALGNTRINFFGTILSQDYPLLDDVPIYLRGKLPGAIVFYLAVWENIGIMAALADIPWEALIFEGHQQDNEESLSSVLAALKPRWRFEIATSRTTRDGDCEARPLFLLLRTDSRCRMTNPLPA